MKKPTVIDLFCGAGGLSCGFEQAGFKVVLGNDIDEAAGKTFEANHENAKFVHAPVQDVSAAFLLKKTGLAKGELDCLVGGPPCQGFSVYNHQRGMHDERSHLFKDYLRLVEGLQPKWIVMENVTGLLSIEGGNVVERIRSGFAELGYRIEWKVLKAEEYGVAQERRRIVFLGTRSADPIVFPETTHGAGKLPFIDIWQAIGNLPPLENGGIHVGTPEDIYNHMAPKLSAVNLERMKHIPPGGSWRDIPIDLLPEGMKRAKRSDHTKRYGRMDWNKLSCTILTKCDVHWGAYIHPEQDRAISVREAARLQSFPDDFVFSGSMTDQFVQVGNSVPPLLARKVAEVIARFCVGEQQGTPGHTSERLVA